MDPWEADLLAQSARSGDGEALTRLYQGFAPALLAYLRRVLGHDGDAQDALQETFLRLCQGRGPGESRGHFRQWLFTVATNVARDHWRRDQRRLDLSARLSEELAVTPIAHNPWSEEQYVMQEMLALVESALADLPEDYAAAFHLRLREGFSYREMATITGEGQSTLRSRVHHSLKRLRARLAAIGDVPERGSTRATSPLDHKPRSKER